MHDLQSKAMWANGITDENIPQDRILEMRKAHTFCLLTGCVAVVVNTMTDPPSVEAWHQEIEGTGFLFTKFSDFGYPTEIKVSMKFQETGEPFYYYLKNYPVETIKMKAGENEAGEPITKDYHVREKPEKKGHGFFIIRTPLGLNGVRGLPAFLPLMHPIRAQLDILNSYTPYAKKQGMGFPFMGLKDNSPQNRARVKTAWSSQPQTNRFLLGDAEDVIDYIQPLAGSYDPFPMLTWIDQLIARKTQMNKLMLEGTGEGQLSSSETAITNWVNDIKEQQVFWRAQWLPIWLALGADDTTAFNDPSKPAFISLMEGLQAARAALDGLVEPEDLVNLFNEYLEKHDKGKYKLRPISDETLQKQMDMAQPKEDQGGDNDGDAE